MVPECAKIQGFRLHYSPNLLQKVSGILGTGVVLAAGGGQSLPDGLTWPSSYGFFRASSPDLTHSEGF